MRRRHRRCSLKFVVFKMRNPAGLVALALALMCMIASNYALSDLEMSLTPGEGLFMG